MPAGRFDINAEQGTTFILYANYQDSSGNAIDLASYTNGRMQVRRSNDSQKLILSLDKKGVTGGGITGEFGVIFGGTGAPHATRCPCPKGASAVGPLLPVDSRVGDLLQGQGCQSAHADGRTLLG